MNAHTCSCSLSQGTVCLRRSQQSVCTSRPELFLAKWRTLRGFLCTYDWLCNHRFGTDTRTTGKFTASLRHFASNCTHLWTHAQRRTLRPASAILNSKLVLTLNRTLHAFQGFLHRRCGDRSLKLKTDFQPDKSINRLSFFVSILIRQAAGSSETLIHTYHTTWRRPHSHKRVSLTLQCSIPRMF
jgi:hypothetical protein